MSNDRPLDREPGFRELIKQPGVQVYMFLCLVSLGLIMMVQLAKGSVLINGAILLVGILGIVIRFQFAPVTLLLILGIGELMLHQLNLPYGSRLGRRTLTEPFSFTNIFQSLAFLGYAVCQFRLQAFTDHLFPRDPRLREQPRKEKPIPYRRRRTVPQRRSTHLFTPVELGLFLLALPIWALVGQWLWYWVSTRDEFFGIPNWQGRLVLCCWVIFLSLGVVSVVLTYWRWAAASSVEAKVFIQDVFWRETRREQRRQYRWLAWARVRGKFRKDKS